MSTPPPFESDREQPSSGAPVDEDYRDDDGVLYEDEVTPEYGILGFTLRELIIVGLWLVAFVVSFISFGLAPSLWSQGITWVLPIGVPTVAVFLIVLRRFSPDGIRRVGSLGIDQFASVAFSVAAVWWAQVLWGYTATVIATGATVNLWASWVEFGVMLGLVAVTVFGFLIPGVREDFHGRLETLAHRSANPVRPVIARPRAVKTPAEAAVGTEEQAEAASAPTTSVVSQLDVELSWQNATDEVTPLALVEHVPLTAHASGGETGTTDPDDYTPGYARRSRRQETYDTADDLDPIVDLGFADAVLEPENGAADEAEAEAVEQGEPVVVSGLDPVDAPIVVEPVTADPVAQPFWALAPTERDVFDEHGEFLFRIGPDAWALVIEDRGGAYVVRHDDGRIGYLHDIADITKG